MLIFFLLFGWHLIVTSGIGNRLKGAKVNVITNSVRVSMSAFDDEGDGTSNFEYLGASLAVPHMERTLNNWAKSRFDLYAMIIPYTVSIEP